MATVSAETEEEFFFQIKSHCATAVFGSFKDACLTKQARESSYVEGGEHFAIAIDKLTFAARIVPLRDLP